MKKEKLTFRKSLNLLYRARFLFKDTNKLLLVSMVLILISTSIFPVLGSWVFKNVIDSLAIAQNTGVFTKVLLGFLIANYFTAFLETMFLYLRDFISLRFQLEVPAKAQEYLAEKCSTLNTEHFETAGVYDKINQANQAAQRSPMLIHNVLYVFSTFLTLLFIFVALYSFQWWLPIVIIALTAPFIYFATRATVVFHKKNKELIPENRKIFYLVSVFRDKENVQELSLAGAKDKIMKDIVDKNKDYINKKNRINLVWYKPRFISPVVEILVLFFVMLYFVKKSVLGDLSIGEITFISSMLLQLAGKLRTLVSQGTSVLSQTMYLQDYFEFLDLENTLKDNKNAIDFTDEIKTIEFKKVSFSYPNGQEVFKNISLKIDAGQQIAFVGENGAGKTTLIKLLCRFYDPTSGSILINGIDLKDISIDSWHRCLGLLSQNFCKYQMTVKENIIIGNGYEKFSQKRMLEAAKMSGADKVVAELKGGYNQLLGRMFEGGQELSVGQWQKIAIARAFYSNKPVVILDEPTSAVDAGAEYEIFESLKKHMSGKTVLFVSHRFSTVRHASQIIVVDKNKITEKGTHKELMAKNGMYARLFKIQSKGYEE